MVSNKLNKLDLMEKLWPCLCLNHKMVKYKISQTCFPHLSLSMEMLSWISVFKMNYKIENMLGKQVWVSQHLTHKILVLAWIVQMVPQWIITMEIMPIFYNPL